VTVADAGQPDQTSVAPVDNDPPEVLASPPAEDQLRAEVQRLTAENERYRAHAERTSRLFLAATDYAEWVRESARRDAELALRKARARVEHLEATARGLEQAEQERARLQGELARLQTMVDETRTRLSTFLAAGLEALNTEGSADEASTHDPRPGDLQDTLHRQLPSTAQPEPAHPVEGGKPER
jgi:predicted RNase H-like nuclease (RuvC/YqgF family)